MTTYPNQKVIHINKNKYTANFLQVGIDEWQTAFKKLTPSAFAVYLYLASNADGFDLALSQKAIENALGIKKTAYHTAIEALKKEGYIEVLQGNIEVFHTAPVRKREPEIIKEKPNSTKMDSEVRKNELPTPQMRSTNSAKTDLEVRKNDIEIDNINNINKIDKEFLPTEETLDGFAIEPVKQESINQNNEAVAKETVDFVGDRIDLIIYTRKKYPLIDKEYKQAVSNKVGLTEEQIQQILKQTYANAGYQLNWKITA